MTINLGFRTDALVFLQSLNHPHSLQKDQGYILNDLNLVLQSQIELIYLYSYQVSSYLERNIERGMNITQTIQCMLNVHSQLRREDKRRISQFLDRQYRLEDSWKELKKLQKINKMLIPDFLQVINGVGEWHRMEIQEKEFRQAEKKDWIKQLDILYTSSHFQFQNRSKYNLKTEEPLLCIYRILFENQLLFHQFIKQERSVQKLTCSLFYVSSSHALQFYRNNFEFSNQFGFQQQNQKSQLKVVIFVIGEMCEKIENFWKGEKNQMLIDNYRLSIAKNTLEDQAEVLLRLKAGISGLIASKVSLDREFDLLWLTKIVLDLKGCNPSHQAGIIKEIKNKSVKLRILLERIQH